MKNLFLFTTLLLSSQFVLAEGSGIPATDVNAATPAAEGSWKYAIGGGIAYIPRYEGSSTNRLRFAPLLEVGNGHFFAGTSRGIGYNFSGDKNLQYGVRLTVAPHRKQNQDVRLNGMGDISATGEVGGFVNARISQCYVSSSIAISSHGSRFELGGGYEMKLSEADTLRTGLELNWADGKFMQTYFGVSASQAAASGGVLKAYNASSGIKDYALKLNWKHSYSKEWFSNAGMSLKEINGNAKNSPLTMRNSANSSHFVVGYNF